MSENSKNDEPVISNVIPLFLPRLPESTTASGELVPAGLPTRGAETLEELMQINAEKKKRLAEQRAAANKSVKSSYRLNRK